MGNTMTNNDTSSWTLEQHEISAAIYNDLNRANRLQYFDDFLKLAFYRHDYVTLNEVELDELVKKCNAHLAEAQQVANAK